LLVEQKKNSGLKNEYFHPNPQIETGSEKRIGFWGPSFLANLCADQLEFSSERDVIEAELSAGFPQSAVLILVS